MIKMIAYELCKKLELKYPKMYQLGFRNNNCFKTGCVQGGIGYWQKMERDFLLNLKQWQKWNIN